jgi:hypothetical protein
MGSNIAVLVYGKFIVTTFMHYGIGPLLMHGHAGSDVWHDTKEAAYAFQCHLATT